MLGQRCERWPSIASTLGHVKNCGLSHISAHIGWTGPEEPSEDGEMNDMTLPSRRRIQNSRPDGLRASTLPLVCASAHPMILIFDKWEEKHFLSLKIGYQYRRDRRSASTLNIVTIKRSYLPPYNPADTRRWINIGLTLVHRLRRWTNVKPTLIQRLVPAGKVDMTL